MESTVSLPDAGSFLREGITLDGLHKLALSQTDIEAARQVREAREAMLHQVAVETRPLYGDVWSFAASCAA